MKNPNGKKTKKENLRWELRQRLEFIESRLFWVGKINRVDLVNCFGISTVQASSDIARYREMAPKNLAYAKDKKTYFVSDDFEPIFIDLRPENLLGQLQDATNRASRLQQGFFGDIPQFSTLPTPTRQINIKVFQKVLTAVRIGNALEVKYQSMSRPEPIWRWISPHSFSFDGKRWHVRAFCFMDNCFKDFLLARILEVKDERPGFMSAEDDVEWNTIISLKIGPHPELTDSQKKIIEADYGMQNGVLTIQVRRALLFYFLKRMGLEEINPNPKEQQIVLLSREGFCEKD